MDQTKSEYEFLDLTDINEEERSSLTTALFSPGPVADPPPSSSPRVSWPDDSSPDPSYDLSLRQTGPATTPSGPEGPPVGEDEMAHSPRSHTHPRGAVPPPAHESAYSRPPPAPPVYPAAPAHNPSWVAPSNVYVSQVTANVNVHGYMSQYYRPHPHSHPQAYGQPVPQDTRPRESRRGRRGGPPKRAPSPPRPQPFFYYPQYYPSAQTAQGAPLYHLPVYPQVSYLAGYPYATYEYPIADDQSQDKSDEYLPEGEREHVQEMYYRPAFAVQPGMYDPNEAPMPFYSAPPPRMPVAIPAPMHQPSHPTPHQFNVHAKNFVRQGDRRNHVPREPRPRPRDPSPEREAAEIVQVVEPVIVEQPDRSAVKATPAAVITPAPVESIPAEVPQEAPKPTPAAAVVSVEACKSPVETVAPPTVAFSRLEVTETPVVTAVPPAPVISAGERLDAGPAPFAVNKPFVKGNPARGAAPQRTLPAKAPFASKHRRDLTAETPPEQPEVTPAPVRPVEEAPKRPSAPKAVPVTASVARAPFRQPRRASPVREAEAPPAVRPAPLPSDFPPPPPSKGFADAAPEPAPVVGVPVPGPPPPSVRSFASLFSSPRPAVAVRENDSQEEPARRPAVPGVRPVAKVGPFDPLPRETAPERSSGTMGISPDRPLSDSRSDDKRDTKGSETSGSIKDKKNIRDERDRIPAHVDDPDSYRIGRLLSTHRLEHQSVSFMPRGMSNRSNYCYANATLQALIACPPFYNMLNMPFATKRDKSSTPVIDAMVELCHKFTPMAAGARVTRAERNSRAAAAAPSDSANDRTASQGVALAGAGPPLDAAAVLRALRDVQRGGDSFRVDGRQEDAEEFLGCLLNGLNDEMLEVIKFFKPEESKDVPPFANGTAAPEGQDQSEDDDEWKVMGPKNKGSIERRCLAGRTPLSDIFQGELRSRLQRAATDASASDTTHCVQPFFTLPLDIERSNSVREALERVAGRDRVEGVVCGARGRAVEAWQQWQLEKLPQVLLLHLKCFHCRPHDGATVKIVKAIEYPVDLKIDPKIISSKMKYGPKQRSYKLFAVVYHEGAEAEKGHYSTDAYHAACGGWLRYDDSLVSAVTEHQVLHPRPPRTPYLLLYRRQDTVQTQTHQRNQ